MTKGIGEAPVRLNMAFGERLLERIDRCARDAGIGRTELIRRAADEFCDRREQHAMRRAPTDREREMA